MGVTVITGASSGIGRSLARRLARHGDALALFARRTGLLDSLAAEIGHEGGRALAIPCDVTDRVQVAAAFARVGAELGPVTRMVACAGGGQPTFVQHFNAAEVEAIIRLNLIGVANCVEAVLPGMLARGDGHLVAVGSLAGYRGLPTAAAYSAAKAGLGNFMESLRMDLRPHGIAVTLLEPGFVRTKPGKARNSRKPFRLDLETATAHMERAVLAQRPRLAFPWPLALAFSIMRILPAPLYDRLLSGRGRKPPDAGPGN
jgi:short-subunit dehydrogenase